MERNIRYKKRTAILLLLATLMPPVMIAVVIISFLMDWLGLAIITALLGCAWGYGLLDVYFHLIRTDGMDPEKRLLWMLVLLFTGVGGMIVFWYLYIWESKE